ncbi:MAG: hypothetical protein JXR96_00145 [Deltaproteobacteria bacterium]|nr:hypothetical protein [Deltaproteobacteria bacterium]
MRKCLAMFAVVLLTLSASPAMADFFAFELDGQGTYTRLQRISFSNSEEKVDVCGLGAGVTGRLQILFINLIVDYQHFFDGADYLHGGLGAGYRFDSLPLVDIYVRGSLGVMLLYAEARGFDVAPGEDISPPAFGFQARAGGGIEIPFLGDWFAFGVGADFGAHAITGNWGYDLTVNVHLGLRI